MQTLSEYRESIGVTLEERYRRGELRFEEKDLTYSATERCSCGAGLARLPEKEITLRFWHCSRCLLEGVNAPGGPGEMAEPFTRHDDLKPFYRWDIQAEGPVAEIGLADALSAHYLSTRPDAKYTVYTIFGVGGSSVNTADEAVAKEELFRIACGQGQYMGTVHMNRSHYVRNDSRACLQTQRSPSEKEQNDVRG